MATSDIKMENEFLKNLSKLYTKSSETDVTLICGGKVVKTHRAVLGTASPLFKSLFKEKCCCGTTVILDGFNFKILDMLVTLLYAGSVKGTTEELIQISNYAKLFCMTLGELKITSESKDLAESQLEALENEIIVSDTESESESDSDGVEVLFDNRDVSTPIAEPPPKKKPRPAPQKNTSPPKKDVKDSVRPSLTSSLGEPRPASPSVSTSNVPATFKCYICVEEFLNKYRLTKHRKTHNLNPQNDKVLNCAICNKAYKTTRGLSRHLRDHIEKTTNLITSLQDAT